LETAPASAKGARKARASCITGEGGVARPRRVGVVAKRDLGQEIVNVALRVTPKRFKVETE